MAISSRRLVERFYHEAWNKADEAIARAILHADFRFRASLGPGADRAGRIHRLHALDPCRLGGLHLHHRGPGGSRSAGGGPHALSGHPSRPVFGVPATGREIAWAGASFFMTDGCQITELWVLGDVDAVKQQLGAGAGTLFGP
ncbi:MAG: hypothetical protein WDN49_13100 [Acetobacteraceae bacterium]